MFLLTGKSASSSATKSTPAAATSAPKLGHFENSLKLFIPRDYAKPAANIRYLHLNAMSWHLLYELSSSQIVLT